MVEPDVQVYKNGNHIGNGFLMVLPDGSWSATLMDFEGNELLTELYELKQMSPEYKLGILPIGLY